MTIFAAPIGSGCDPSVYCSKCHRLYGVACERCPNCRQPQWLTLVTRMVRRWSVRSYRAACALGGDE